MKHADGFAALTCGFLVGFVAGGYVMATNSLSSTGVGNNMINYADTVIILLMCVTIVVGIILPIAGVVTFIFSKREASHEAQSFLEAQIKDGDLKSWLDKKIDDSLKDEEGVLRRYINTIVEKEIETSLALHGVKTTYGNEKDEYGDV